MIKWLLRLNIFLPLFFCLLACTPIHRTYHVSPATLSQLQYGKRLFEGSYYRRALKQLLPLACDGNAEAQYAVGYMYFYGYGVAQDTDVGYFWISRSASKNFQPAVDALVLIHQRKAAVKPHTTDRPF